MFTLTSIAINSSLTPKQTHVYSSAMIMTSLSFFLQLFYQSFQALERRRRDWSFNFIASVQGTILSLQELLFKSHRWKCEKMSFEDGAKIQNDPTVNEFEIIFLLGYVWVCAKKREGFGKRKKGERIWKKKKAQKYIVNIKTNLRCLYL